MRNIISALFVIVIITVTQKLQFKGKIIEWIGDISYELYIVHFVMLTMFRDIEERYYLIAVLVGGLIISTILWKYCKQIKKPII